MEIDGQGARKRNTAGSHCYDDGSTFSEVNILNEIKRQYTLFHFNSCHSLPLNCYNVK